MELISIKTKKFLPPQDDIYEELDKLELVDGDILIITSKVVSIHEGACIKIKEIEREELLRREAEYTLDREGRLFPMTIKYNMYTPFSGVDESNSNGYYTLLPKNPDKTAKEYYDYLKKKHNLNQFAVLIIDSNCLPLRFGLIGNTVGFYGLRPIRNYEGKEDLFGRVLQMSRINIVDNLACMATIFIGQGNEQIPMLIVRGMQDQIEFEESSDWKSFIIKPEMDFFSPMFELYKKN